MNYSADVQVKNEPGDIEEANGDLQYGIPSQYFSQPSSSYGSNCIIKDEVELPINHLQNFANANLSNVFQNHGNQDFSSFVNHNIPLNFLKGNLDGNFWPSQGSSSEYFTRQHPSESIKPIKGSKELLKSRKSVKQKSPKSSSPRKKIDRFNGVAEEEVAKKLLPDHIDHNLDIVIIGINPGLFAAHVGHHYAGPGNHFWKCLFLSGMIPEPFSAYEDFKLLQYGIGFTNMVARTTRGSADLSRKEIAEGGEILLSKLKYYQPKVAVFNGKGIYEVFSKKKDFSFGKQPEKIEGTNTYIWVMPSSSARCAQLPRAIDKVPFYLALKKLRDNLNGLLPDLKEEDIVFTDLKLKNFKKESKQECKEEV